MRGWTGRTVAWLALLVPALPHAAVAAPLTIARTVRAVPETPNGPTSRILPGTFVDYEIMVTNQVDLSVFPARMVTIEETVSPTVRVLLTALGANGSPVQLEDGSLLGTGLLPSGVTFDFASLDSATDGLDFSDGTGWGYRPKPGADGYDPALRGIRVRLGGSAVQGRSFRLRYRVYIP